MHWCAFHIGSFIFCISTVTVLESVLAQLFSLPGPQGKSTPRAKEKLLEELTELGDVQPRSVSHFHTEES